MQFKGKRRRVATGVYERQLGGGRRSFTIQYVDSDGKNTFKVVDVENKEQAKPARADVISKLGRGEQVRDSKLRFEEFAAQVIDGLSKRPARSRSTATTCASISSPSPTNASRRSPRTMSRVSSPSSTRRAPRVGRSQGHCRRSRSSCAAPSDRA